MRVLAEASLSQARRPAAPSPCKAVCVLNAETGFCLGCYRTVEEIGGWMMMTPERKLQVLDDIAARRAAEEGGATGG